MGVSRGHHFVPQGYLKNFTDSANKKQLVVFGRDGERFNSGTGNIAKKRDFNTVRGATPPDIVETYYAGIEDGIAVALREVRQTGDLTQQRLDPIIALIAILHVRSPRKRSISNDLMASVARRIMGLTVRDKLTYESILGQMRTEGQDIGDNVSYDVVKKLVEMGGYAITTETEAHINLELNILPDIEGILRQRNWCLLVAPKGSQFVTCDHPSNLLRTTEWRGPPYMGLGLRNTEVFLPISPKYALAGRYEEQIPLAHVDFTTVAERNAGTIFHCSRQVYAHDDSFMYKRPSEFLLEMKLGSDLVSDPRFIEATDSGS